ncbi:MAG: DUF1674 domain-containing protein [Pseudomarimonas sp.]
MIGQRGVEAEPEANSKEEPALGIVELPRAREIGGREGPEPTRYGDWEKNGRCIDF